MGQVRCEICFVLVDEDYSTEHDDWHEGGSVQRGRVIMVTLFKDTGKYYTSEGWRIPDDAIGPWDMERSVDFRRIGRGSVLVEAQEPWGYPHLIPNLPVETPEDAARASDPGGYTRARETHPSGQGTPVLSAVHGHDPDPGSVEYTTDPDLEDQLLEDEWNDTEPDDLDCEHDWPAELYGHSECTKCGMPYDQYAYIPPT